MQSNQLVNVDIIYQNTLLKLHEQFYVREDIIAKSCCCGGLSRRIKIEKKLKNCVAHDRDLNIKTFFAAFKFYTIQINKTLNYVQTTPILTTTRPLLNDA